MKKIVFLLLVQNLLSGCGLILLNNAKNKSERTYDDRTTAEKAFSQSTVECNESDCPPYAGGLYTISETRYSVGACSMTLIGPDRVLTNSHCIPDDISYKGAGCRGRILVNFPKTDSYDAERIDCHSIENLVIDGPRVEEPDWAIIKLMNSSTRPSAQMNLRGIPDHSDLTLYKIDFDLYADTPSVGYVTKTGCKGNTNLMSSGDSAGPVSALVSLSHCDVKMISGNSGSGYFNSQSQLVGLHSFGIHVEDSDESWAVNLRLKYPKIKQNTGGGTNLACIPVHPGWNPPPECQYDTDYYFRLARLYSKLSEEEANGILWENLAVQAIQKNEGRSNYVEYAEDVSNQMDRFDVNFSGEFGALRKGVFEKLIKVRFPALPSCIKSGVGRELELSILESVPGFHVDPDTFYRTRSTTLGDLSVDISNQGAGFLQVTFQASAFESDVRSALGWSLSQEISLKTPICP